MSVSSIPAALRSVRTLSQQAHIVNIRKSLGLPAFQESRDLDQIIRQAESRVMAEAYGAVETSDDGEDAPSSELPAGMRIRRMRFR